MVTIYDQISQVLGIFSNILLLTAAYALFRTHKLHTLLLTLGVIFKNTPSFLLAYLMVPADAFLGMKLRMVGMLSPFGATLIGISLLMLAWQVVKAAEARRKL